MVKIGTDENTSDLLTKHTNAETLKRLIGATGYRMKLASECVEPERLELNRMDQLKSADIVVKLHEEARQAVWLLKLLSCVAAYEFRQKVEGGMWMFSLVLMLLCAGKACMYLCAHDLGSDCDTVSLLWSLV